MLEFYENIQMGEGMSGSDDTGFGTSAMYSCIGVAFVNLATRKGGLYHYPANTLSDNIVWQTLRQMIDAIRPSSIVITPAQSFMLGGGSEASDVARLRNVLTDISAGAMIRVVQSGNSAQLLWNNGAPQFNCRPHDVANSADDWETSETLHRARSTQTSSVVPPPYQLGGGRVYYGINMELDPPLNQPGGTAAAGATSQPQRRSGLRRIGRTIRNRCRQM